jgi:hypothetical protein
VRIIHLPRAALALIGGIFITFSQSHAASIGLTVFALFALLSAVAAVIIERKQATRKLLALSLVSLIAAVFAVIALIQGSMSGYEWFAYAPQSGQIYEAAAESLKSVFLILVAGWALITGAIEVYLASREGFSERSGRDFVISAIFSFALGILFLVASLDVVSAVGFFGAYLILLGVHWGLATAGEGKK